MIVKQTATPKAFQPRTVEMLRKSFEAALGSLNVSELSTDQVKDLLARRIMSAAEHGETDPVRLRNDAIIHVSSMMRYLGAAAEVH